MLILVVYLSGCATNPKPWTNTEKALAVASILATGADAYTTTRMLDNPNNWEVNPIMGKHPSDGRVIATMAATQALFLVVCHYWEDARPWLLGAKTIFNTGLAIHNSKLEE
jgi:hypothetical protein